MKKKLMILGSGGHANSVWHVAVAAGYEISAFIDPHTGRQSLNDIPVLPDEPDSGLLALGIGDNYLRLKLARRIDPARLPVLAHPSAVIAPGTMPGAGTVLMPHTTLGPGSKTGLAALVNTNASLDHDSVLGDGASLGPGAHTGGNVTIGEASAIGIGATISHQCHIHDHVVIGAGATVITDMPANTVAVGCPAKVIRQRTPADSYL